MGVTRDRLSQTLGGWPSHLGPRGTWSLEREEEMLRNAGAV